MGPNSDKAWRTEAASLLLIHDLRIDGASPHRAFGHCLHEAGRGDRRSAALASLGGLPDTHSRASGANDDRTRPRRPSSQADHAFMEPMGVWNPLQISSIVCFF
jgi:hypothetical protein